MTKNVVLLTGLTGFLGSHIAEELSKNYIVVGIIRKASDLSRYEEIKNENIHLVNSEDVDYKKQLELFEPHYLIHCAWMGVAAQDRDHWNSQIKNISFTYEVLQLAKDLNIKKFIGLGSQAEYGIFSGSINEDHPCKPLSAYGAAKLSTLNIVESFCKKQNISWYWLRIFPMYGIRESFNYFIPSVIKTAIENSNMDLTQCEQLYGYMYVGDFCKAIAVILEAKPSSGIYNLAANASIRLRDIVELIINRTASRGVFKFGALPYRPDQVMHMEGDASKFYQTFDFTPKSVFKDKVDELITYYKNKLAL